MTSGAADVVIRSASAVKFHRPAANVSDRRGYKTCLVAVIGTPIEELFVLLLMQSLSMVAVDSDWFFGESLLLAVVLVVNQSINRSKSINQMVHFRQQCPYLLCRQTERQREC